MSSAVYRLAIGVVVVFVFSAVASYRVTNAASGTSSDVSKRRIREGTTIHDRVGYFRQDGDGATFVTEGGLEFGGLPNLNLERVVRTLKTLDESKSNRWSVSGVVTEFSGRNFLLISRAVYKSTPPPAVPESLSN
ncbi:MAG: hypothetical protein GXP28_11215 [Planctomycetes bacterium]|nr:hypothetical protein [Planctomycetota bacterium]